MMDLSTLTRMLIPKGEPVNSYKFREAINWLLRNALKSPESTATGEAPDMEGYTVKKNAITDIKLVSGYVDEQGDVHGDRIDIKRGDILVKEETETDWSTLVQSHPFDL